MTTPFPGHTTLNTKETRLEQQLGTASAAPPRQKSLSPRQLRTEQTHPEVNGRATVNNTPNFRRSRRSNPISTHVYHQPTDRRLRPSGRPEIGSRDIPPALAEESCEVGSKGQRFLRLKSIQPTHCLSFSRYWEHEEFNTFFLNSSFHYSTWISRLPRNFLARLPSCSSLRPGNRDAARR